MDQAKIHLFLSLPWRILATCPLPLGIFLPRRGGLGTALGRYIAPILDKPVYNRPQTRHINFSYWPGNATNRPSDHGHVYHVFSVYASASCYTKTSVFHRLMIRFPEFDQIKLHACNPTMRKIKSGGRFSVQALCRSICHFAKRSG